MKPPTISARFGLGFLAALWPVTVVNFIVVYLMNFIYGHLRPMAFAAAAATSVWVTVLASPVVAVGVAVALLALFKWGWLGLGRFALLGTLLGVLPMVFFTMAEVNWRRSQLPFPASDPILLMLVPSAYGALSGACSATAFWFLIIRVRRDEARRSA
jgi:hypothetical protein